MSASQPPAAGAPPASPGGTADPSMEDILASIRRILSDDEAEQVAAPDGVLALDASMIVEEPPLPVAAPAEQPQERPIPNVIPPAEPPPRPPSLVAPEAAAATASSVGSLLRTLIAEREQVAVHRGGPTIEDLVREEIRPLLKEWLDANLPALAERLVRAEIERVVGRAGT
jgi:cell pole-organizing protein PopZ